MPSHRDGPWRVSTAFQSIINPGSLSDEQQLWIMNDEWWILNESNFFLPILATHAKGPIHHSALIIQNYLHRLNPVSLLVFFPTNNNYEWWIMNFEWILSFLLIHSSHGKEPIHHSSLLIQNCFLRLNPVSLLVFFPTEQQLWIMNY